MRLNEKQLAALHALRPTIQRDGDLAVSQDDHGWLHARHPDGREWAITLDGATLRLGRLEEPCR